MKPFQGRRRFSKSGPAMKHQRIFTSAEGTSWGRAREGVLPSRKGGSGDLPRENFIFPDVGRDDFNALSDNFVLEVLLIL